MTDTESWYALVSASPRPETQERVNVGLLLGNGTPGQLQFLEGLPRLAGLVRSDELRLMQEVLRLAGERIMRGEHLDAIRASLGPQLSVSNPRGLYREPTEAVVDQLMSHYLAATPRAERRLVEDVALRKQSEKELDRIVSRVSRLGMQVVPNAKFEKLYREPPAWTERIRIPRLARALRGDRRDILIDSVLVEPHKVAQAIGVATSRIGRAFWYYGRLKQELRAKAGKDVITVGVLLDGATEREKDVEEAREYIKHTWTPDADLVVEAEKPADLEKLRERVRWLVEARS
jgi:hypothetical protein